MRRIILLVIGFLLFFACQSSATVIGSFTSGSLDLFDIDGGNGQLWFVIGESTTEGNTHLFDPESFIFEPEHTGWDLTTSNNYTFFWEGTGDDDPDSAISGSFSWYGTLQSLFDRNYYAGLSGFTLNGLNLYDVLLGYNGGIDGVSHIFYTNSNVGSGSFTFTTMEVSVSPIPEPATFILLGVGMIGTLFVSRKIRKRKPLD